MNIRNFKNKDIESVLKLFYDTVHSVNSKDYTNEQLQAWAPKNLDKLKWYTHNIQ